MTLPCTPPGPPTSYSIIFDNLDFYIKAHHQSSLHTNTSLHWVHHMAVQDRIPINHLCNNRPMSNITEYDLGRSLPGQDTQNHIWREFTVLGSRILTDYLEVFKTFSKFVVHHIPHQYSVEMSECSSDYPLGLLFKNENKTAELVDVLHYLQNEYVPRGPDGVSSVLVGGDRLTEGNCRNIQWAFADGATKEDRLEGLVFMFEDWHAIRNLLEIHYKIFFRKTSAKEHGTLFANMNMLRCSNAKQGPSAAYKAYKDCKKDTTALFIAAAMEHFGLTDMKDTPRDFIPEEIQRGTPQQMRDWLDLKTSEVVDKFVMPSDVMDTSKDSAKKRFPSRQEGCGNMYIYEKARETYEHKKHNLMLSTVSGPITTELPNEDHQKNHSEARLGFGFLLLSMLDAVKEGDGECLLRLYKLALLFYKACGHSQYAYSTFLLTLQVNCTLSPRMAHSVTWNRFWNGRGGKGKNIPLDLHLEHLNNYLKSFLKGLGPNLNKESAHRISRSIGILKDMMDNTNRELEVSTPSGLHHAPSEVTDIQTQKRLSTIHNGNSNLSLPLVKTCWESCVTLICVSG